MPNRLAAERSPYLLQHAGNPVDWHAWGQAAFEQARTSNKPIFLSIGYSTCHWCHVMEHESFENADVARALNENFVSIKVDREERPDVDRVYMAFVQATTGSGGWPMSVWLTPDLEPFFGGTYFPPSSRWGRPGFIEVLQEIARAWSQDREKVLASAHGLVERLRALERPPTSADAPGPVALAATVTQFAQAFDQRRGGFGDAPKFPRPSELLFLLRESARTGDGAPREMALRTLRAMALGGMRDHIGGGFHRYSVDGDWRVPHFEKMLYDQAQLVMAYLEAAQASGDEFYGDVAEDTLQYVHREMTDRAGGFLSAEDADSVPPEQASEPGAHKSEGAFYLWRDDEIGERLGPDADLFRLRFGIAPDGNAPFDPQHEFTGKNLLYVARSIDEIASMSGQGTDEVANALAGARMRLFAARTQRPRPHLDDKVLTSWNGLMIGAFARAARTLAAFGGDGARVASHLGAAQDAATFIRDTMWDGATGALRRRYRDGHAEIDGYAEDYAYLIAGLLELFQADGNPAWLDWTVELQRSQDERFWDRAEGGWFSTDGRDRSVLLRLKEDYDGAEPAASSVSVLNLLALRHLVGGEVASDRIERTLRLFGARLEQLGRGVPMMAAALSTQLAGVQQVVILGPLEGEDTSSLVRAVAACYLPFALTLVVEPGVHQQALAARLPFIGPMRTVGGRATAFVCRDFTCRQPVNDIDALFSELGMSIG